MKSSADFEQLPVFNQLLRNPARFHDDFVRLPRRMQANLRRILRENAGEEFQLQALVGEEEEEEEEIGEKHCWYKY